MSGDKGEYGPFLVAEEDQRAVAAGLASTFTCDTMLNLATLSPNVRPHARCAFLVTREGLLAIRKLGDQTKRLSTSEIWGRNFGTGILGMLPAIFGERYPLPAAIFKVEPHCAARANQSTVNPRYPATFGGVHRRSLVSIFL